MPYPDDQVAPAQLNARALADLQQLGNRSPLAHIDIDTLSGLPRGLLANNVSFPLIAPPKVRTAVLGDSIAQFAYETGTLSGKPFASVTNRSWYDQANALLGLKLNIVARAGVAGDTLAMMLARFDAQIAPSKPNFVIVEGPSNDLDLGYSADQTFPKLMAIFAKCRSIGAVMLFVGTAAMRHTAAGGVSPADGVQYNETVEFAKIYAYARQAAAMIPGFMFYDMAQNMRDYTVSTTEGAYGTPIAGTQPTDITHPTPYGCYLLGAGLANFLAPFLAGVPVSRATVNGYGANGDQGQMFGNTLLLGSAGTVSAGNTGTAPDQFTLSRSGGIAVTGAGTAARTDGGPGKKWSLPIAGATATTDYVQIAVTGASYARGIGFPAWLQAAIKVAAVTSGSVLHVVGNLQFLDSGFSLLGQVFFGRPHSDPKFSAELLTGLTGTPDFGLMRSAAMNVPVGTARVSMTIQIYTTVGAQLTVEIADLDGRVDLVSPTVAQYL